MHQHITATTRRYHIRRKNKHLKTHNNLGIAPMVCLGTGLLPKFFLVSTDVSAANDDFVLNFSVSSFDYRLLQGIYM